MNIEFKLLNFTRTITRRPTQQFSYSVNTFALWHGFFIFYYNAKLLIAVQLKLRLLRINESLDVDLYYIVYI